jgi:Zn-dependent membrane protease YugP
MPGSNYFYYYGFDLYYLILIVPALLLGLWASYQVNHNFKKYSSMMSSRGYTGADAAGLILRQYDVSDVGVSRVRGNLTDHYDPKNKELYLSDNVYGSTSVAAIGVAAHEAGHAIQHAVGYFPIRVREVIVPVTQISSFLYMPLILFGLLLSFEPLISAGILLFAMITLFQVVTLPVEFNASRRALKILEDNDILYGEELTGARHVLRAAALTYVAAMMTSIAQLLRFIILFGGNRRRR